MPKKMALRLIVIGLLFFTTACYAEFTVKVHRVGQGNCVTVEVPNKEHKEYMIIDCGTAEFAQTLSKKVSSAPQSPPMSSSSSSASHSSTSVAHQFKSLSLEGSTTLNPQQLKKTAISSIQKALGLSLLTKQSFHVKTVVISHPDEDHFNWLPDILTDNSTVENIVLGGHPDKYLKNDGFRNWLYEQLSKGTQIYFLAVKNFEILNLGVQIKNFRKQKDEVREEQTEIFSKIKSNFIKRFEKLIDTIKQKEEDDPYEELDKRIIENIKNEKSAKEEKIDEYLKAVTYRIDNPIKKTMGSNNLKQYIENLANSAQERAMENSEKQYVRNYEFKYELGPGAFINKEAKEQNFEKISQAFDFGGDTKFELLVSNPLHIPLDHVPGHYVNLAYDDDNVDSLVLKAVNGKAGTSMVFTGDATGSTIERMRAYFYRPEDASDRPKEEVPGTTTEKMRDYYRSHREAFHTNVLMAAHHGSNSEGSNNKKLADFFTPDCVIFSNGQHGKYHHPKKEAYDNLKVHTNTLVKRHYITLYGLEKGESQEQYHSYTTKRPIFSALDSGTITINFEDNRKTTLTTIDVYTFYTVSGQPS